MGRKKAGQEQLCDHIARNKSRAKKSAEKVEEKLRGKRMIPDPARKGCYIYVDDLGSKPQGNELVDELDHVRKFGPGFGSYPVNHVGGGKVSIYDAYARMKKDLSLKPIVIGVQKCSVPDVSFIDPFVFRFHIETNAFEWGLGKLAESARELGDAIKSMNVDLEESYAETIEFEDIPNEKPQGSEIDTIGLKAEVVPDPKKLGNISFVDAMIDYLGNGCIIKYD